MQSPSAPPRDSAKEQPRTRLLTAAAVLGAALAGLALWVLAAPGEVTPLDRSVGTALHSFTAQRPAVVDVSLVLELVGGVAACTVIVAVVVIGLLVHARQAHDPALTAAALFLGLSATGAAALNVLIKGWVERERPPWNGVWSYEHTPSFPSGHSQAGVSVWIVLGLVALLLLPAGVRWWVAGPLLLLGPVIGVSRALLGVHWPTDVLGGWIMGAAWVCVCAAAVPVLMAGRSVPTQQAETHPVVAEQHHRPDHDPGDDRQDGPEVGTHHS